MATEDLTTYTETDPDGVITVTSSKVTLNGLFCDRDAFVYKDFGASHFNNIDLLFTFRISSSTSRWGSCDIGFGNTDGEDVSGWIGHRIAIAFYRNDDTGLYYTQLYDGAYDTDSTTVSVNTIYYCRLVRADGSGTATLYIYTNAARTTLHDTIDVTTLGTTTFRYLYAACSYNFGDSLSRFYGYTENFILSGTCGQVRVIGMMM